MDSAAQGGRQLHVRLRARPGRGSRRTYRAGRRAPARGERGRQRRLRGVPAYLQRVADLGPPAPPLRCPRTDRGHGPRLRRSPRRGEEVYGAVRHRRGRHAADHGRRDDALPAGGRRATGGRDVHGCGPAPTSAEAVAGSAVELIVDRPGGAVAPVPLDVLFLLDATGSMGDEIDQLKTSIDSVAARVAALDGSPDVRFGMTLYRDEGDAFVTSTYDFTGDVDGVPGSAGRGPRRRRRRLPRGPRGRFGRGTGRAELALRRARRCSSSSSWPTPRRRPSGTSRCTYPDGRHGRRGPRDQDLPGGLVRERRPRRGGVPADGPGHGCTLRLPRATGPAVPPRGSTPTSTAPSTRSSPSTTSSSVSPPRSSPPCPATPRVVPTPSPSVEPTPAGQ